MDMMLTEEIDKHPSRRFKGYDWSEHQAVKNCIEYLFNDYLIWAKGKGHQRIKEQDEIKNHLKCILLEAYRTYKMFDSLFMSIPIGNKTITSYKKSRYKPHHYSYRILNHVIDFLKDHHYFEFLNDQKGRATGAPSHQRATRVRAYNHLIQIIEGHGVNRYMISTYPEPPEIIVLRKTKRKSQSTGENQEYEDNDFTFCARGNLRHINDFIEKHYIDIELNDEQEAELIKRLFNKTVDEEIRYLDFNDLKLKRIFNNSSFEQGGRFYGGFWQKLPREYRYLITINDKRTIQLDYSGMHFAMLYARVGAEMPDTDPYHLDLYADELRPFIKTAFNILINCSNSKQAISTIDNKIHIGELHSDLISGQELLNEFRQKHPLISQFIASGQGVYLQFWDSQIAERILIKGMENGVCILPIHDGFITYTGLEGQLHEWMREAFLEVMGSEINIKQEPIYLEILANDLKNHHTASVTDFKGDSYPIDEYPSNGASSFSVINTPEEVLSQIDHSNNLERRRNEWCRAHNA